MICEGLGHSRRAGTHRNGGGHEDHHHKRADQPAKHRFLLYSHQWRCANKGPATRRSHAIASYRDTHLGPEFKAYENLEFAHTNVVPHLLGADAAYVTADYAIKAKTGDRDRRDLAAR